MGVCEMRKVFIPKTKHVNKGRKYFADDKVFIKCDINIERGINEATILKQLNHKGIPELYKSYIKGKYHVIEMERMPGETLERLKLSKNEKKIVLLKLFDIYRYLRSVDIVHGDIGWSNVLFDGKEIYLIDWETGKISDNFLADLCEPPQGIIKLINRIT